MSKQLDTFVSLDLFAINTGPELPDTILVYDALEDSKIRLIKILVRAIQLNDIESASSHWENINNLSELQRELVQQLSEMAFEAPPQSFGTVDKERNAKQAIDHFCELFNLSKP